MRDKSPTPSGLSFERCKGTRDERIRLACLLDACGQQLREEGWFSADELDTITAALRSPVSETRPTTLSEFVHAPNAVREAIGAEVVEAASQRQSALSAEQVTSDPWRVTGEAWILFYEDQAVPQEIFSGHGAEQAARSRYDDAKLNWSCHLFATVEPGIPSSARAILDPSVYDETDQHRSPKLRRSA